MKLALEAQKIGAGPIRYLNCGGGFASRSRLHGQYLPPEQVTPSFDRYAEAICDTIVQAWPADSTLPRLYLETGRALVDEAGYLISTADGVGIPVFGLFEIPALVSGLPDQADVAGVVHLYLAWVLVVFAGLHGLAALKHHFIDRDATLVRMLGRKA